MDHPRLATLCLFSALVVVIYILKRISSAKHGRLPPGPRPLPLIGNAFDVPTRNMGEVFRGMAEKYGDVVYLNALGQPMVVLGSHEAAIDLLEKKSSISSDRTLSTMVPLAGWEWAMTLFNYGTWWRRHRRTFHQYFNATAVRSYHPSQELEARRLALRLMREPGRFLHHGHFAFMSSVMRVSYGMEFAEDDEYVKITEDANATFGAAFVPGKYWVETFPILRFLPAWLPGAAFKRDCAVWRPLVHSFRDIPWARTVAAFENGTAVPSMATSILQRATQMSEEEAAEERIIARNVAAVAFSAGVDTTVATIQWFFLAMAAFPDTQKRAQAELDAVVGPRRLPECADAPALPYVSALVREILRWRPATPLGIPHRTMEDDEFRGYWIPKGSIVVPNAWAYLHDPERYPNPEAFSPERFLKDGELDPNVLDPTAIAFGYGRRICPGRHFARSSLFISMATVLHTLSIDAPLDGAGKPVELEGKMIDDLVAYPVPFEVDIRPRGPWAETLVEEGCNVSAVLPA